MFTAQDTSTSCSRLTDVILGLGAFVKLLFISCGFGVCPGDQAVAQGSYSPQRCLAIVNNYIYW